MCKICIFNYNCYEDLACIACKCFFFKVAEFWGIEETEINVCMLEETTILRCKKILNITIRGSCSTEMNCRVINTIWVKTKWLSLRAGGRGVPH